MIAVKNKVQELFSDGELTNLISWVRAFLGEQDLSNGLKVIEFHPTTDKNHWHGWADWADWNNQSIKIWFGEKQTHSFDIQMTSKGKKIQILSDKREYAIKALTHEMCHIVHPGWTHPDIRLKACQALREWRKTHRRPLWERLGGAALLAALHELEEKF